MSKVQELQRRVDALRRQLEVDQGERELRMAEAYEKRGPEWAYVALLMLQSAHDKLEPGHDLPRVEGERRWGGPSGYISAVRLR